MLHFRLHPLTLMFFCLKESWKKRDQVEITIKSTSLDVTIDMTTDQ